MGQLSMQGVSKKGARTLRVVGPTFQCQHCHGLATNFICQPAPNNSKERELDAAFLSTGVHVNVDADSGDNVEELPTLGEGQSRRRVENWAVEPVHLDGKKKKGGSLDQMIKAILGFTEKRNRRLNRPIINARRQFSCVYSMLSKM